MTSTKICTGVAGAAFSAVKLARRNLVILIRSMHRWHLIGSLRIEETLREGDSLNDAATRNRERAEHNAHFYRNRLEDGNVVFIGDVRHSRLYDYAVPLVKKLNRSSLLCRTFRTAAGSPLPLNGKHWSGYMRSCRAICDLDDVDGHRRATILRDAIAGLNDSDLLAGL